MHQRVFPTGFCALSSLQEAFQLSPLCRSRLQCFPRGPVMEEPQIMQESVAGIGARMLFTEGGLVEQKSICTCIGRREACSNQTLMLAAVRCKYEMWSSEGLRLILKHRRSHRISQDHASCKMSPVRCHVAQPNRAEHGGPLHQAASFSFIGAVARSVF